MHSTAAGTFCQLDDPQEELPYKSAESLSLALVVQRDPTFHAMTNFKAGLSHFTHLPSSSVYKQPHIQLRKPTQWYVVPNKNTTICVHIKPHLTWQYKKNNQNDFLLNDTILANTKWKQNPGRIKEKYQWYAPTRNNLPVFSNVIYPSTSKPQCASSVK